MNPSSGGNGSGTAVASGRSSSEGGSGISSISGRIHEPSAISSYGIADHVPVSNHRLMRFEILQSDLVRLRNMLARSETIGVQDDRNVIAIVHTYDKEATTRISLRLALIDEQEHTALSTNGEIQVAITIQIRNGNLHAAAGPSAIVDHMAHPFDLARVRHLLIPVDP